MIEKEVRRLKKKIDELTIQKNQIESENKTYLETLMKFAKGDKLALNNYNQIVVQSSNKININQLTSNNFMTNQSQKSAERAAKSMTMGKEIINSNFASKSGKSLTLKQLKDVIEEIYEAKTKFDKKNYDSRVPMETMHQYLFTHLNQKYGLKVIINLFRI